MPDNAASEPFLDRAHHREQLELVTEPHQLHRRPMARPEPALLLVLLLLLLLLLHNRC